MPRKTVANDSATAPVRAAKPKTPKTAPVVSTPRVKSAKHKTDTPIAVIEIAEVTTAVNAQEAIAKIAYGYWKPADFSRARPKKTGFAPSRNSC